MWKIIFLSLGVLGLSAAQVIQNGQCVADVIDNDLDLQSLIGEWNELIRTDNTDGSEWGGDCSTISITEVNDTIYFNNEVVNDNFFHSYSGTVEYQDGTNEITLQLEPSSETINLRVLITNYISYAVFYSCEDISASERRINVWQLSRNLQFSELESGLINTTILNQLNIENTQLKGIIFSDDACYILPVIEDGQPIVLPGECESNIPSVGDFNSSRFAGLWHDISFYQPDHQQGTCGRTLYTLRNEDTSEYYDIVQSQVFSQALSNFHGVVIVTDEVLEITLNVTSTEQAHYNATVLATDYDDYAILYACVNVPENYKQVYSWIISRTRQLSSTAQAALREVIDSRIDLNDLYYQQVNQTDVGCFYFPEPVLDQPVVFPGQCDLSIPAMANFSVLNYTGLWHEIESYPSVHQTGTCNNINYDQNGSEIDVYSTQVFAESLDSISGVAEVVSEDGSAKLVVTFPVAGTNGSETVTYDYWVLDTDYESYALVYTCQNIGDDQRGVWSWKLSRTKQLTDEGASAIDNTTDTIDILDEIYYQSRDQTADGCFYYPVPEPGKPVVFPGQCDDNITVESNFNISLFEGIWHEIETYPRIEVLGQCVNHEYTLGTDNTINLVSSQIFDHFLLEAQGYVVYDDDEGSAKLNINLNINGTTISIPYWILSTDYIDYALAYSCINLNSDYRQVWSWKLSRSKELSENASTAIDSIIAPIQVLGNDYYEPVDQFEEACFYLPDLLPGEPIVLVGQCDPNITVVSNFNTSRFAGRWRVIESYPSDSQIGSCLDVTYTLYEDGSGTIRSTQVVNETLVVGSFELQSDGNGKLIATSNDDENEPAEYWILETNYDSYALVYSCSDINIDQRRVWSWKLSRVRDLSTTDINAIEQVVDSINVLNNRYFESYDHTDDGCFYYPVPDGNPVFFRGRCDEDLAVVSDFDLEEYLGIWFAIESYPQEFQIGTCPTSEYSSGNEAVNIMNTEVIAQRLYSINGTAVLQATNDTLAKLDVTFSLEGIMVSSPYWVLATDYQNYALVYSCTEIDEEYRRVSSWKLSRNKTLSEASIEAINNVTSDVQVLRPQYYEDGGHTDENCFFYPENYGGPVILNGQCEDAVSNVVNDFDASAFAGIWHEVSRFPSELQTGQCAASNYELTGDNSVFAITQTIVGNERLTTITGTGMFYLNGTGIIYSSFDGDSDWGLWAPINLYVLDTDYEEFALLYSCRDITVNTKQVYSWKLSKTQSELSETANSRIEQAVTNHIDLYEGYYEYTEQSYDSCFYYPVFEYSPAFIELPGVCDERIQGKADFHISAYLGRWFEIAKYPQESVVGECARVHYEFDSLISSYFTVRNTMVINRTLESTEGYVLQVGDNGVLSVTLDINGVTTTENYLVLETDYDNYAVVYKCDNLDNGNSIVSSWKLSRQPTLSNASNDAVNDVVTNTRGLLEEYYTDTLQTDEACFYVPEFDSERSVVFRGQCETITGVENFDVQRYLGWWHEIERYPTDNAVGDCISSRYQLSDNQYVVVDTTIYGQTYQADTSFVVASDNGLLRINSTDRVVDIWILATDYETYSLLYTCENINDEYRRVWSAKHSKSRQLTEEAEEAMTLVMEDNDVLYNDFYVPVNQSDEACFHYPTITGDRVILPGQCDTNIPTVQDFQTDMYSGTWYHIERYPVPNFRYTRLYQDGTCLGTRYTWNDEEDQFNLLNWDMLDEELRVVEGNATVITADGGPTRMILHLPIYGELMLVSTELYILATDYVSYSLVYNCLNVNEFQRSVAVWKLSRTRSLPAAANTAIHQYMTQREELFQPYFIVLPQSTDCEDPNAASSLTNSVIAMLVCIIVQLFL